MLVEDIQENYSTGWVKMYRSFMDWEWYTDGNTLRLFLHLLLKANHKEQRWRGQIIKTGQVLTGRKVLSAELNMGEQSIRTALRNLESTKEISSKVTNKFTIITICNYVSYQNTNGQGNQQTNHQLTINQPTTNQQLTTNKNVKNVKNDKKLFSKPTIEDIKSYCSERKNNVPAEKFYAYYDANGWKVGRNTMKNWKAAVRYWEKGNNEVKPNTNQLQNISYEEQP